MAPRSKYLTPPLKLALDRALITEKQFDECKSVVQKYRRKGEQRSIEEVVVEKGILSAGKLEELRSISQLADSDSSFGNYRIKRLIGEGGMGKVYEAEHEFMHRPVALKVIYFRLNADPESPKRFFQEIRALAKLNHPNIVTIYDAGHIRQRYYFCMELITGASVKSIVEEKGKLSEKKALKIIRAVAVALSYAHKNKVIHRDIKPDNILIDSSGSVKLTDFGLVMHHDSDHLTLTREGVMVGTVYFASPEQVEGKRDIDGRSDIFSLGVTLYYMLTGSMVYTGKTFQEVLGQLVNGYWRSPKIFTPAISRRTVKLLRKMMARSVSKRFQTMDAVIRYIDESTVWNIAFRSALRIALGLGLFLAGFFADRVVEIVLPLIEK
jgi:serine/threonine protein kinase